MNKARLSLTLGVGVAVPFVTFAQNLKTVQNPKACKPNVIMIYADVFRSVEQPKITRNIQA